MTTTEARADRGNGIREAYLASLFQDSDVGMLTEKRAQSGALSQYKVVVLPAGCNLPPAVSRRIQDFRKSGGAVVQCQPKTAAKDLWPVIHSAAGSLHIKKLVSADQWGVECRSVKLGGRRIFYLINYQREPVDVQLRSSWPLTEMLELRTQTRLQGNRVTFGTAGIQTHGIHLVLTSSRLPGPTRPNHLQPARWFNPQLRADPHQKICRLKRFERLGSGSVPLAPRRD